MLSFLRGSKASITIVPARANYQPGESIQVQIKVSSEQDLSVREGRVALCLKHELQYRNDEARSASDRYTWQRTEREIEKVTFLPEGVIPAGSSQVYECTLTVPATALPTGAGGKLFSDLMGMVSPLAKAAVPPTCAGGKIIRVYWWVKATLDRKGARDVEERADIVVFNALPGINARAGRYGVSNQLDEAEMALDLPSLEWALGETIEGQLLVCPQKAIDVSEVRVELVRVERVQSTQFPRPLAVEVHVGSPRGLNEAQQVEKVKVADGGRLQPGQELAYPFRLTIPTGVPPSCEFGSASVTWLLRGILARRMRSDTQCEIDLQVAGARA